jgi:NitT/TauT family transport system ATP-binding protein
MRGVPVSTSGHTLPDQSDSNGAQPAVVLDSVSKVFANGTAALAPTSLSVNEGEFVSFVGPSGCGKSTLLRIVAGLVEPTSGRSITAGGATRTFVFQEPTLLPWRNVLRNCELLLELEGVDRAQRTQRARRALRMVGLDAFEKSYPRQLSGGMKMRLSLARALAVDSTLMLMDEPFSAIDEITREGLNDELQSLWLAANFTGLFVTHSVYEAVYLSQRVVVLSARPGRVVAEIDVPLPFPRTPEDRTSAPFGTIAARVAKALREQHS